jgi:hypothetical protein
MSPFKQLPGLLALAGTILAVQFVPADAVFALPPLAIAGIGLGAKALGGLFGGLRRRKRRKQQQAAIRQGLGARLEGLEASEEALTGIQRGAIQSGVAQRAVSTADQERQLETLQQEAAAASGGAQAGLSPAQLESVIRANALSNLQIDASVADTITRATQRAAVAKSSLEERRGELRGGAIERESDVGVAAGEATDRAVGSIFESAGSFLSGIFS